jgi:hypothetical protein
VTEHLFSPPARTRRERTSTALVPVSSESCPDCGAPTFRITEDQRALFFHGGYGGTTRTVTVWCWLCRWGRVAEQTTENPRHP